MKKISFFLLMSLLAVTISLSSCFRRTASNQSDESIADSAAIDSADCGIVDSTVGAPIQEQPDVSNQSQAVDDQDFVDDQDQESGQTNQAVIYYYPDQTQTAPQQSNIPRTCTICNGVGDCKNCNGSGSYDNPYTGDRMPCSVCHSTGKCWHCNGTGVEP